MKTIRTPHAHRNLLRGESTKPRRCGGAHFGEKRGVPCGQASPPGGQARHFFSGTRRRYERKTP